MEKLNLKKIIFMFEQFSWYMGTQRSCSTFSVASYWGETILQKVYNDVANSKQIPQLSFVCIHVPEISPLSFSLLATEVIPGTLLTPFQGMVPGREMAPHTGLTLGVSCQVKVTSYKSNNSLLC